MAGKPSSIDEYLSSLSREKRAALERLRKDVQAAVPRAQECISYGIPAFRLDGKVLVWFGAGTNHCAFYPGAHPIQVLAGELENYETSKGTIRFVPEKPLPASLVRRLVKVRIEETTSEAPRRRADRKRGAHKAPRRGK
jgi:uncharacterized protein YdhG (YjbR/CyaY superfamily)